MSGTIAGGRSAARTNKKNDPDFYKKIGKLGGRERADSGKLHEVGFASDKNRAREAGRKGGLKSRRGKAVDK